MNNWLRPIIMVWVVLSCRACPEELSSEGTRVCKSKAQSGALFLRRGSAVVPFYLEVRRTEKNDNEGGLGAVQ